MEAWGLAIAVVALAGTLVGAAYKLGQKLGALCRDVQALAAEVGHLRRSIDTFEGRLLVLEQRGGERNSGG